MRLIAIFLTNLRPSLCACLLLALASPLAAQVQHQLSGFATLGLVSNSNPNLVYRRDVIQHNGSYDGDWEWRSDSLLGLQWQGRWSPEWETSVQLVAKDRFDNQPEDALEWAFVRYRPVDGLDIRLGRLGVDAFLFSDYRQVGYTYPWARPPHETYGLLSMYHLDGADVSKRFNLGDARLDLKAFYGKFEDKFPTDYQSNANIDLDFDLAGGSAVLELGQWKSRVSYVRAHLNGDYAQPLILGLEAVVPYWAEAQGLANQLKTDGEHAGYLELGLNYDNNLWWLQAEWVRISSETSLIGDSDHGYVSLGRRLGDFSLFVMAGYAEPRDPPVAVAAPGGLPSPLAEQLQLLASATDRTLNGVLIDQRSYSLGARWDFRPRMALKLQLDEIDIAANGTNLWFSADQSVTRDQSARVLSITLDMLF